MHCYGYFAIAFFSQSKGWIFGLLNPRFRDQKLFMKRGDSPDLGSTGMIRSEQVEATMARFKSFGYLSLGQEEKEGFKLVVKGTRDNTTPAGAVHF